MTATHRKAAQDDALRDETPFHGNLIGGRETPARDGRALEAIAPAEGRAFARIARSGPADVDRAVADARAAFECGAWGRMAAAERGRVLSRLGAAILAEAGELAALEARDTGKPIGQARADIAATARYFEFYGGAADKLHGDTIPFLAGYTAATVRDPHGVTAHIVPWNYPSQIFGRSVGAALACGNACVVKPAEEAGLVIHRIARLALGVGLPEGALNVVSGLGEEAGAALASHPGVDFISFTGSPEVGALIQTAAARNHVGVTLELGGKSPQIVFADADIEAAAPVIVRAITQNGGQTCSAGSRVLIERRVFDAVAAEIARRFSATRAGPPEADLDLGPMISQRQRARVAGFVARARAAGASLIAEGAIAPQASPDGYFVAPSLFGPVARDAEIAAEEVFGPVLSLIPFDDEADAIRLANGTAYGLVAGVWTRDAGRSLRVARAMRCGQVFINGYGAGGGVELPFGGVKKSGHGREKGFDALYEFSAVKTIVIHHG